MSAAQETVHHPIFARLWDRLSRRAEDEQRQGNRSRKPEEQRRRRRQRRPRTLHTAPATVSAASWIRHRTRTYCGG